MTNSSNVAILIGDISNFSEIEHYISKFSDAQIFTLNFKSHQKLSKNKLSHEIAENFLKDEDYVKINTIAKNASINWYKNNEIEEFLMFESINLGNLLEIEFFQYLLTFFTNALTIERIIHKSNFKQIIVATEINPFVQQICENNNMDYSMIEKKQQPSLVLDNLNIKTNLGKHPISFKISRKQYSFLKNQFEKIIFHFLGYKDKQINEKLILL